MLSVMDDEAAHPQQGPVALTGARRPNLPERHANHVTDEVGIAHTRLAVLQDLRWVFREQRLADYGIDAHIEVVDLAPEAGSAAAVDADDRDLVTGQLIAVQAKSGPSCFEERKGDGWVFRESHRKHLNYWLVHSLPVIITLYHPERRAVYWQRVDVDTVRLTDKGFTVHVPERQQLAAPARSELEDVARRRGQHALAAFKRSLSQLPPVARGSLARAAEGDRPGAARLGQTLADGRAQPRLIAQQLLAAAPTWMVTSPACALLWSAVAGFSIEHEQHDEAVAAFLRAAEQATDPVRAARWRAFAGLALLKDGDRERARALLSAARAGGAVLLADMGLVLVDVPVDVAPVLPVPESLQSAEPQELDAEPTALNFLAEMRLRDGDLGGAVALMERAVSADRSDSGLRLRLAILLSRRIQSEGVTTGNQDIARARHLAEQVLQDTREWSGPSTVALRELLDLETLFGDPHVLMMRCSPAVVGGTAIDEEAADPSIAYRGARAALLLRDAAAAERFVVALADDPRSQHIAALVLDLQQEPASLDERLTAWTRALDVATDDAERATIVGRLAALGQWPLPAAEDLRKRSVAPEWMYQLWRLKSVAADKDPAAALPELRVLAREHVPAAIELIDLVERLQGAQAAYLEWRRQFERFHDILLLEVLPFLVRGMRAVGTLDPHSEDVLGQLQDRVGDAALPASVRLRLRRLLVELFGAQQEWQRVVRVCETGLAEQADETLAWNLVIGLANLGRVADARRVLLQHRPNPLGQGKEHEQHVRLWAQLLVGTDLDADLTRTLTALVDQHGAGTGLGGQLAELAVRELARLEQAGELPDDLRRWQQRVLAGPTLPGGLRAVTPEQLEQELAGRHEAPLESLRVQVRAGAAPLASLAEAVRRPYGQVLLQRATGMTLAEDLEPGLQQAGRAAAAAALAGGPVLADLSALYLLVLLEHDGAALHAQLPEMQVLSAVARDAALSRDAIWTATGPVFTVSLQDGRLRRETLDPTERALLRRRASELEDLATHLPSPHEPARAEPGPVALQQLQLDAALRLGLPLYADDVALRQRARVRGLAAFGTVDLLQEASLSQPARDRALLRLAHEGVVDLPLLQDHLLILGGEHAWQAGPALLLLSRAPWWRRHQQDWTGPWRAIAVAASKASPAALTMTTAAALSGALAARGAGWATQRYQQLLVEALDAVAEVGTAVLADYLQRLAENAAPGIAPRPRYVHAALVQRLQERDVPDTQAVADRLLPEAAW